MKNALPAEVAAFFDLEGDAAVLITRAPDRVKVDLQSITLAQARQLVADGKLPMLKAKKKKKAEASVETASEE